MDQTDLKIGHVNIHVQFVYALLVPPPHYKHYMTTVASYILLYWTT
jgi:hypothetical protein